jgi:bifunctional non-homologous end joining protein LigD
VPAKTKTILERARAEKLPKRIEPMLARTGPLPQENGQWAYEIKWDGVRAIAFVQGGRLVLQARSGRDITPRYPELRPLAEALAGREVVLDGEVVAFDGARPSFQKLQGRMHLTSEHAVRRLAREDPVHYIAFDLLYLDGRSLLDRRYDERRAALAELGLAGPTWQAPAHHVGDGAALLELTRSQGLEGVIAKRLDCPYLPGRRSPGWVKVKNVARTDVVIGGWLPGERARAGKLGALVIGIPDDEGVLRYAGRVGTGFSEAELVRLGAQLESLARPDSPFVGRQPPRETRFVEPRLVAVVDFNERTQAGTLRQPSYKGLRDDIAPEDVRFG